MVLNRVIFAPLFAQWPLLNNWPPPYRRMTLTFVLDGPMPLDRIVTTLGFFATPVPTALRKITHRFGLKMPIFYSSKYWPKNDFAQHRSNEQSWNSYNATEWHWVLEINVTGHDLRLGKALFWGSTSFRNILCFRRKVRRILTWCSPPTPTCDKG